MKIVVSGKGGVGKTTFAGTLARIFSDKGYNVIAADSDPSMNLHLALGMENPRPISEYRDLITERTVVSSGIYNLKPKVDDIVDEYSSKKENIKLLVMGTVEVASGGCMCPESTFLRALLRHMIVKRGEYLILDTEAGLEHIGRGIAKKFDLMVVVVEPSAKALETANRIHDLSVEMGVQKVYAVGNKISSDKQLEYIKNNLKFEILGFIPFDEAVIEADMNDTPLWGNDSKALESIIDISGEIEEIV